MLAILAGVAGLIVLAIWWTTPSYTKDEPQPIPHTLPFLGHALTFANSRRELMKDAFAKANGNPFTLLIAGRKHYVFSSPADISTINRNPKSLSMALFVELLHTNLFGMNKAQAQKHRKSEQWIHKEHTTMLLGQEYYDKTASTYFRELEKSFEKFEQRLDREGVDGAIRVDAFELIKELQAIPTATAYFGTALLDADPDMIQDFQVWVQECFWKSLVGLPDWTMRKGIKAREKLLRAILKVMQQGGEDRSEFIKSFEKTRDELGWDKEGIAKEMLGFLFGIQGNSLPTAYAILLRLVQDPAYLFKIRSELDSVHYSTTPPTELIHLIPHKVPHLQSLWWETLRYSQTAISIREVLEPVTISGYTLQPGNVTTVPSGLVHRNPSLHPDPETFIPDRFLPKEMGGRGQNAALGLRPFGGGVNYCPGRVFAQKQVIGVMAGVAERFEIKVVEGVGRHPEGLDFEEVVGLEDVMLEVRRRVKV